MIECPKCKWQNRDDAVRCANCSAEIGSRQQPTPQPPPPQGYQPQPPQQPYGEQQGYPQPYQYPGAGYAQSVPDNLIWSILVTVFCCLIPGIVAIVKASEANSKKAAGDYHGALAAYNASRTWMFWSIGLGLVGIVLYGIMAVIGAMSGISP